MRRFALTLGAIAFLFGGFVRPAGAQSKNATSVLTHALTRGMDHIGGSSGALVVDLNTGTTLFSWAPDIDRIPASVEKLYTTSTALLRFGPSAVLTTTIRGVGTVDASGAFHGTLYLVGGGDPTFGSASFDRVWYGSGATMQRLVANLIRATGIRSLHGAIVGDESHLDSARGTPPTGYHADLPDVEGELSALAYNRGFADLYGNVGQPRPALYAAQQLETALRSSGVRVPARTSVYTEPTPAAAVTLATVHSPQMTRLIALTNTPSDNFFAELLLKDLGASFGGAGTTAAGATVVRSEMAAQFGIHPRLADGSGLSYSDATSPSDVVTLLKAMAGNRPFYHSLSVTGQTGTLKDYGKGTAAQGNCHGKTGTLSDVANMTGYCHARDGHTLVFAFMGNSVSDTFYVHTVEASDMAAALASYDG